MRDIPKKGGDLACDRSGYNGFQFAAGHESTITCARSDFALPSNIADLLRQVRLPTLLLNADTRPQRARCELLRGAIQASPHQTDYPSWGAVD